jgi:hypothetical protein
MSVITHPGQIDIREVAKTIKAWLDSKGFETKALQTEGAYIIKARKASGLRAIVGADRALKIEVRNLNNETQVGLRQGSWKTNIISNAAWLIVTGGANLLISGWSLVIQKELEAFVRETLNQLSGVREVEL